MTAAAVRRPASGGGVGHRRLRRYAIIVAVLGNASLHSVAIAYDLNRMAP